MGLAVFLPLLLWSRGLVWSVFYTDMTPGQQARAAALLRENAGLEPGARVSQEALDLDAGEYALLQSGEFSWASVNFFGGRLEVETAAAQPAPAIFSGKLQTICARTGGLVTAVEIKSGTALVQPGQQVEAGQPLIGTSRTERDGTPIFAPAAGTVTARFAWSTSCEQPLKVEVPLLDSGRGVQLRLSCGGLHLTLPRWGGARSEGSIAVTRHVALELFGLPLPVAVEETAFYARRPGEVSYPDDLALEMARLTCLRSLEAAWPDAEIAALQESVEMRSGTRPIPCWEILPAGKARKKSCRSGHPEGQGFLYAAAFRLRQGPAAGRAAPSAACSGQIHIWCGRSDRPPRSEGLRPGAFPAPCGPG